MEIFGQYQKGIPNLDVEVIISKGARMDDNKVAVLLEQLLSEFRNFGDGLQRVQKKQEEQGHVLNGLVEDMDIVKPTLKGMEQRLDSMEGRLGSMETKTETIDNRLEVIEGEIIKLNPDSQAIWKQVK